MKSLFITLFLIASAGLWYGQEMVQENIYAVVCEDQFGDSYVIEYSSPVQYDWIEEFDLCLMEEAR